MERIEGLVDVMINFGEQLGNLKGLIGEMQDEMTRHTVDLKKEVMNFKQNLYSGVSVKTILSEAESELQERLARLKKEMEHLEVTRQERVQLPLKKSDSDLSSISSSPSIEEISESWSSRRPERVLVSPYHYQRNTELSSGPLPAEWWKQDKEDEELEPVDWPKECAEREELKLSLMIKEGWKKQNSSYEELEEVLRTWTGRFIKWQVARRGKARNGKALLNVYFENFLDRQKVYNMRKEIAEEGYIFVGEALAYVERKERWKMLTMAERLRNEGRNVEFENKKICVDGQWWKYCWTEGWKRV